MTQTLQDSNKLNKSVSEYYQNSQSVSFTDPWFGSMPTNASNSVVGMRRRGIATTKNIGDSIAWSLFEKSLQNWDFRYDPLDRKIYCYWLSTKDFSSIPEWWISWRTYREWEYVMSSWVLYKAIQNSDNTRQPWFPSWDWYWIPQITFWAIFPYDLSNTVLTWWFDWLPVWSAWTTAPVYLTVSGSDDFWSVVWIWFPPEIPQTWYYIINARETRDSRPWWDDVMSRIIINDWLPNQKILSECYRYTPTISATASSSGWITTTVSINQWIITRDTTSNTRIWYLDKWDIVNIQARTVWWPFNIIEDFLQITRLF